MGFPADLALATRNPGKISEIMRICSRWPVRWHLARSLDDPSRVSALWPGCSDPYLRRPSMVKGGAVAEALGVPAVADDSGIEVDALGGDPGPRSARFAGPGATDRQNLDLLIERIRDVPQLARGARYRCVAVCAWPDGREVWAEAVCEGSLILEPRGSNGFGYDPVFVPEGERRTMAELPSHEKDAVSHRGKAFRELGEILARSPA